MNYVCPSHHNLESWGDAHPSHNTYSLMQPTIAPLFDARQFEETLLKWSGNQDYYTYLSNFGKIKELIGKLYSGYFDFNDELPKVTPITSLDPKFYLTN